jgi:hypothetical protein
MPRFNWRRFYELLIKPRLVAEMVPQLQFDQLDGVLRDRLPASTAIDKNDKVIHLHMSNERSVKHRYERTKRP